ncbi:MAG TPA: tetratricopeptide repeat protein [Phycisphaerales bacterium]|nr:tetratricopeptide repeat protein [Phycisphaerales bacterium]
MYDAMEPSFWDQADQAAGLAFEMYESGELDMALTQIQEAIDINPANAAWHFNKGLTLDALERFEEAVEAYLAALEIAPDDPEILNSLAVDYTRTGRYDKALAVFEHIQQIDPTFEPCYCNRIITYTEIDQHDKAEEMFYLAQQINPDCPICFYNIGNSLFSRGQFDRAIWCWKRTAMLEPTHPQINYRIAQAYWAANQPTDAEQYFLEELRTNPGDTDVILDFGLFLLRRGRYDAAREKFHRIRELAPDAAPPLFYLGEIERALGHADKAEDYYRSALTKSDILPGPRFRLAEMAAAQGRRDAAFEHLRAEYDLDITDIDVLMRMGALFLQLDHPEFATDCFLRIVDEHHDHAEAFHGLGLALRTRGELDGALRFFEHALKLGKREPALLVETARLYLATERHALAAKTMAAARRLAPRDRRVRRYWLAVQLIVAARRIRRRLARLGLVRRLLDAADGYRLRVRRVINSKRTPRHSDIADL